MGAVLLCEQSHLTDHFQNRLFLSPGAVLTVKKTGAMPTYLLQESNCLSAS